MFQSNRFVVYQTVTDLSTVVGNVTLQNPSSASNWRLPNLYFSGIWDVSPVMLHYKIYRRHVPNNKFFIGSFVIPTNRELELQPLEI